MHKYYDYGLQFIIYTEEEDDKSTRRCNMLKYNITKLIMTGLLLISTSILADAPVNGTAGGTVGGTAVGASPARNVYQFKTMGTGVANALKACDALTSAKVENPAPSCTDKDTACCTGDKTSGFRCGFIVSTKSFGSTFVAKQCIAGEEQGHAGFMQMVHSIRQSLPPKDCPNATTECLQKSIELQKFQ